MSAAQRTQPGPVVVSTWETDEFPILAALHHARQDGVPLTTTRDLADAVGMPESKASSIVGDLMQGGYLVAQGSTWALTPAARVAIGQWPATCPTIGLGWR